MENRLKYVRDAVVSILGATKKYDLCGVISCYNACPSTEFSDRLKDKVDITLSVLPLYEDKIFPSLKDEDRSKIFLQNKDVITSIFKKERDIVSVFHNDYFNENFNKENHFLKELLPKDVMKYTDNLITIGNNETYRFGISEYFNKLSEINNNDNKFLNSIDQCYFNSGCKELLLIPISLLSTPVFLLALEASKIYEKEALINDIYNLTKVTVRHYILTNLIDDLKNELTKSLKDIKTVDSLINRFREVLCKILLPRSWEKAKVLPKENNWENIQDTKISKKEPIYCVQCHNMCHEKIIEHSVCGYVRYLSQDNSKITVRVSRKDCEHREYVTFWPSTEDQIGDNHGIYYFHFFIKVASKESVPNDKYIITFAQTSFKFPFPIKRKKFMFPFPLKRKKGWEYKWIQEMPDYDIACSQLASMLSSIFNLIFELWKQMREVSTHATRAAISQVMARNMSHNIGSHVMNHLIDGSHIEAAELNKLILKYKSYQGYGVIDPAELSASNQLALFNKYIKCRMDYLSEVTFGVPTMQTTKLVSNEVFRDFDKVRLLLNNISGIDDFQYTLCVKYNGKCCRLEDISISFPSDVLGVQAFYNILENIIRNTAKHNQNKHGLTTFTINISDVDSTKVCDSLQSESLLYYCVEISDGIRLDNIDGIVEEQNERINQSVLQPDNHQLRTNSLGLLEMEASAAFLRKIDMPDIESDDYTVETGNAFYNKSGKLNILKAINSDGSLGYRLFLSKPQEYLFVGDWDINNEQRNDLLKKGVEFRTSECFAKELKMNTIFHHQIVIYSEGKADNQCLKDVFDDTKKDCEDIIALRNCLSPRLLKVDNGDDKKKLIDFFKIKDAEFNLLENMIWELWKNKINKNGKQISIYNSYPGDEIANYENCVILLDHLTEKKRWEEAVKAIEAAKNASTNAALNLLSIEALSSNAQKKLPHFMELSGMVLSNIFINLESKCNKHLMNKIFEAYYNKIVVVDERIQNFSTQIYDKGVTHYEIFKHSNVFIPDPKDIKLDNLDYDPLTIAEIIKFITDKIENQKPIFLLVHYGILERMFDDKQDINKQLIGWSKQTRVIVTSGRGKQSLNLPSQVCYVNLSPISNVFIENRNKYSINYLLNQTRK